MAERTNERVEILVQLGSNNLNFDLAAQPLTPAI